MLDKPVPYTPITARSSARRILMNMFVALTGAYGLSVTGFLVLRAAFGERWSFIGFMNSYAHLLLLPALVLFPLSLILRQRVTTVMLLFPTLIFLSTYGVQFIPRNTTAEQGSRVLTVLSFNVNAGNQDVEQTLKIIREADADMVAFQELNSTLANALGAELGEIYPYQALHPQDYLFSGQGLLSKYLILNDEYWQMHLGHQQAEVDYGGERITFYNVHPVKPLVGRIGFDVRGRAEEISDILNRAGEQTNPVLIMGDFNMTDQSADYQRVTALYGDSYREIGWGLGFTFPNFRAEDDDLRSLPGILQFFPPLARIDYVFHDESFQAVEARVWATSGFSDHYPLLVKLAFKANSDG